MANSFKAYLVPSAVALSLGYVAGLTGAGIPEADAIAMPRHKNVVVELGATAASTFETFLVNQGCPQIVAEFGGTCTTADDFKEFGVGVNWKDGKWLLQSHIQKSGNWTAD